MQAGFDTAGAQGVSSCSPCTAGYFADTKGTPRCKQCDPGKYT
jgi:hypothetical protein